MIIADLSKELLGLLNTKTDYNQNDNIPNPKENRAVLLFSCPDNTGIISEISQSLAKHQANIITIDQHTTSHSRENLIFIRIEIEMDKLEDKKDELSKDIKKTAFLFEMNWKLIMCKEKKRMAIFVSKTDHCLIELLLRVKSNEIPVEVIMVISNHPDLREIVEYHGIPFYFIPVNSDIKEQSEDKALQLLDGKVDFIVLARYMQILSDNFVSKYNNQIINIHHSFLPAFIGANPYQKAFDRGVKLIGATAHYVTNNLDEGPIIQQDIYRANHNYTPKDLKVAGSHVEKIVLAEAVALHVNDKVIAHENKTIVFS